MPARTARRAATPRPTLKATILVAVGAAASLGATVMYESSRSPMSASPTTDWSSTAQLLTHAAAEAAESGTSVAKLDTITASAGARSAKTEILHLTGSVTLDGRGVEKATIYAVPVHAPVVQQIGSAAGVSAEAILKAALTTTSDPAGRFSIQTKEPGEYVILAFSDAAGPCYAKAAPGQEIRLTAPASRTIAGQVVTSTGAGIAKATVMAVLARFVSPSREWPVERRVAYVAFHRYVESDPAGRFELKGLDAANYLLMVSAPDFAAVKLTGIPSGSQPLTVVLPAAASIGGVVYDNQQKPVSNAVVAFQRVRPDGSEEESDDVVTDVKGSYASNRVSAGGHAFVMKVTANGYAVRQMRISPLASGERRIQNVILDSASSLRVRVVGEASEPVVNAIVEAYETEDGAFLGQIYSDANGEGEFPAAAAGRRYRVAALAEGFALKIVPEATTKDVNEVKLNPEGVLEVHLAGAAGEPVNGTVSLRHECDNDSLAAPLPPPTAETRIVGGVKCTAYVYRGLDAGVYTITAEAPDHAPTTSASIPLQGGRKSIDVKLAKGQEWTGRVVDRSGAPVAGVRVQVAQMAPNSQLVRGIHGGSGADTDAAGAFRLRNVPESARALYLTRRGATPRAVAAKASPLDKTADLGDVVFVEGGQVAGRVVDKYGLPVVNAVLILAGGGCVGAAAPSTLTNADGGYAFSGVPAGSYALDFQDPSVIALSQTLTRVSASVEITDGGTTVVNFDARRNGRIYGQVRVRGAIPAQELDVVLSTPSGRVSDVARTRVTMNGAYEIPVPAAGMYSLEVVSMSGPAIRAARIVTLNHRESRAVDLEVGYASISGQVRSAESGLPIPGATVRIQTDESALWSVTSDAKGNFTIQGLPGVKGTIWAQAAGFANSRNETLSFSDSLALEVRLQLERQSELTVRANGPAGPVPGARVHVWNASGAHVGDATTDGRGEASLDSLAAAKYAVTVEHPNFEGYLPSTVLTPGQRTEESIAMQRTGSLVVVVKTKGGEVLANGEVQAVTSTGMTRWTLTDAFGVARFETIAEGKVALHATGFPQATATVAAGEVAQTVVEK